MYNSENLLLADNQRMIKKLQELEALIPHLEMKKSSQYDCEFPTSNVPVWNEHPSQVWRNEEEKTLESVTYCISATEELCGISVHDYSSTILPPSQGLPPGNWKEVSLNIVVLDSLKAAITVIEGEQNGTNRILSLECTVGDSAMTRKELSGLIAECCNSTPPQCEKLLTSLAEYARMNILRRSVIKVFKESHHDNVRIHTAEEGVVVQWRARAFELSWSVQWCDKMEKIQNIISVEIGHHVNPAFVRESEASLRRLTEFTTSPESRLECLQDIAKHALMYN